MKLPGNMTEHQILRLMLATVAMHGIAPTMERAFLQPADIADKAFDLADEMLARIDEQSEPS